MKSRWLAAGLILLATAATARDVGQWEDTDPELRAWYNTLRQPDNQYASCCGEADAYWCDDVWANDRGTFCKITDTRDDEPLRRPHVPIGTEIWIPPHKYGPGKWGNPTGHTIVFMNVTHSVYCFVQQGGV